MMWAITFTIRCKCPDVDGWVVCSVANDAQDVAHSTEARDGIETRSIRLMTVDTLDCQVHAV